MHGIINRHDAQRGLAVPRVSFAKHTCGVLTPFPGWRNKTMLSSTKFAKPLPRSRAQILLQSRADAMKNDMLWELCDTPKPPSCCPP